MSTNKNLCNRCDDGGLVLDWATASNRFSGLNSFVTRDCECVGLIKQLGQAGLDYERGDISIVEYYGIKQAITRELVMLEAD